MRKLRKKKKISVSMLASYADDPSGCIEREGKPYEAELARKGIKEHNKAGRTANRIFNITFVITVTSCLIYAYLRFFNH